MGDVAAAAFTWPLSSRPPLTRPGGGALHVPSSRNVRRCLFGPADHDQLRLELEEQRKKRYREDRQRWNFDFEHERPLPPGRYKWEKVERDPPPPADASADNGGGKGGGLVAETSREEEEEKKESTKQRGENKKITDYMLKRKKSFQTERNGEMRSKIRRRSST